VAALSPVTATLTLCVPDPAPTFFVAVFEPYFVVVPYSNHHLVARPRGSTEPVSVAPPTPTLCATPVCTPGGSDVLNEWSLPTVVPPEFVATIRK
jgi:hypothetical protein